MFSFIKAKKYNSIIYFHASLWLDYILLNNQVPSHEFKIKSMITFIPPHLSLEQR